MLLTKSDLTRDLIAPSVEPGEYTGLVENFAVSYDATRSLQNSGSKGDMIKEVIEPLEEIIKTDFGMDDAEYMMFLGETTSSGEVIPQNVNYDAVSGAKIPQYLTTIFETSQENSDIAAKFENLGFDTSGGIQNFYDTVTNMGIDKSLGYQQELADKTYKQSGAGAFGEFSGSMTAFFTDPTDIASLAIGISGKAKLITKIGQAISINVGVEAIDYPSVTAWTEKVTGSPYTKKEFLRDSGIIAGATAGIVTITHFPVRAFLRAVSNKVGRALTSKEELEAVKLFQEAAEDLDGTKFPENKELNQLENKESVDEITDKENYIQDDVGNFQHNNKVKQTLGAVLRNDPDGIRSQTVQVEIDDIYTLEKQSGVDELNVKDLTKKKVVKGDPAEVDEIMQGQILIFEDASGARIIMDGNKRVEAAARSGQKKMYGVVLKETEGFTREMAEIAGRVRNYYDGTIQKSDMDFLLKYPEMVRSLEIMDPLIQHSKKILALGPRPIVAIDREIISEDIGALIGDKIKDPLEQIAMMDKILKGKVSDVDAEDFIDAAIKDKSLKNYDMSLAEEKVQSLFLETERSSIIDGVLNLLRKENISLKKSKKKQDIATRENNEKTIQLIRENGNKNGEIYDKITRAAKALSNDGNSRNAINAAANDIRTSVGEGRFDRLFHDGQIAKSDVTAQINRVSEEFKVRNKDLIAYSEGMISKQIDLDIKTTTDILAGRADLDPKLAGRMIEVDEFDKPISLKQALDNLAAENKAELDFIAACRKS
tara:strand:+ start:357 stop:2660 length:2304 start_codon:yes stop_codon:yes gene_type:complete